MKNKTTAALLAFFLGYLGGHRFYLGQVGLGILYLLFCWTPIIWITAFIDFIAFLSMSDQSFDMKYNAQYAGYQRPYAQQQPTVIVNNNMGGNTMNQPFSQQPYQQTRPQQQPQTNRQNAPQHTQRSSSQASDKDPFEKAGDQKYRDYSFEEAMVDYRKSLNVKPTNPRIHFKMACLYSIQEQTEQALFHLDKAVEQGYHKIDRILEHDHLAFLRTQPQFEKFKENGYRLVKQLPQQSSLGLTDEIFVQLERLAEMRDKGIINDEEFQAQKSKLLG